MRNRLIIYRGTHGFDLPEKGNYHHEVSGSVPPRLGRPLRGFIPLTQIMDNAINYDLKSKMRGANASFGE
jgi:hypothetical protein